jgi:hypothetical protein
LVSGETTLIEVAKKIVEPCPPSLCCTALLRAAGRECLNTGHLAMPVPTVGMFQHPITFSASRIGVGAMLNTPLNGPIHLQDDEDCGENRDRFKCQRHDHSGVGWLGEKTKADRCDGQPPDQEHQERQWKAFCSILRNSSQDHAEAVVTRMEHFAPNDRQTTINARVVSMAISLRQTCLRSARRDASLGQMRLRPATPIDDTRCGSP